MKRILIDTNLLILLVVGGTDTALIVKHKRTRSFEPDDYVLLVSMLSSFDKIVVTPHILAETSNLIAQTDEVTRDRLRRTFANLIPLQDEVHHPASNTILHQAFLRLGLADCAILDLVDDDLSLITTDLDIYLQASKQHPDSAINFNHVRQSRLLT